MSDGAIERDTIPSEELDHGWSKRDDFIPSVNIKRFTLVDPVFI